MICPHCDRKVAPGLAACGHCGGTLDVSFSELVEALADDEAAGLAWVTEPLALLALQVASVALVSVVGLWLLIVPTPRTDTVVPPLYESGEAVAEACALPTLPLPALEPSIPVSKR